MMNATDTRPSFYCLIHFYKRKDSCRTMSETKSKPSKGSTKKKEGDPDAKMEMMNATDTAFKLFDKDKDGFITRAEFAKVSKKMTKEQIEAIFAKFDNNGDGKMSKEEFKQLMESKKS